MSNINKTPGHIAHLAKSGHDMGQTLKFTSSVGQLLPVYYDFLNPNEKVTINAELLSKTVRPLKSPALTQIDEYLDWFFVPMNVLYTLFEQVYYQVSDIHSSMFNDGIVDIHFPYFTNTDVMELWYNLYTSWWQAYNSEGQVDPTNYGSPGMNIDKKDEYGVPQIQNVQRLFQLLGFGSKYWKWDSSADHDDLPLYEMSCWLPAAYQAIFYSYYRLTDWTGNDPSAYNLDQFYNSLNINKQTLEKLFTLHYRPYRKDFFTNLYQSPLITDDSIGILDQAEYDASFVNDPKNVGNSIGQGSDYSPVQRLTVNSTSGPQGTAKIRGMFALEKLLDITRRAGKHVDDQVLAHFGVKTPRRRSGEVIHIGTSSDVMEVSQLQATATSQNENGSSVLGEYAGNLNNRVRQNGVFHFETEEDHGILMCIYSAVPRADYSSEKIMDKINQYTNVNQLYYPEFDNLGMMPQFHYQVDFDPYVGAPNGNIAGWQYRYQELKQKADRVAGGLLFDLSYWTTLRNSYVSPSGQVISYPTSQRFYCPPIALNSLVNAQFPYVFRPEGLDPADNTTWSNAILSDYTSIENAFVYDPLVHLIAFDVKKSSTMSVYSLPSL